MQKLTFWIAALALLVGVAALVRPISPPAAHAQAGHDTWKTERTYPPLVFTSKAWLDCSISSTRNGRQVLRTMAGQGFTFDMAMAPIIGGTVEVKTPGMLYKFNAFPTESVPASFTGLGKGRITEMKAEVEVDVKRFQQPKGPGTEIRFTAADLNPDAAYVEFTGVFLRTSDRKRFPFRVVFGSAPAGGGSVVPGNSRLTAPLMSKSVQLGTPQQGCPVTTALYEAEDDVRALR
jgi:hypothetical protein